MSERTALNVALRALSDAKWSLEDVKWYRPLLRRERTEGFYAAIVGAVSVIEDEIENLSAKKGKKR